MTTTKDFVVSYKPKQWYKIAVKNVEHVSSKLVLNVYYKDSKGKLCAINVADAEDHEDAIISVKEMLVQEREVWENPILAVINGGKK